MLNSSDPSFTMKWIFFIQILSPYPPKPLRRFLRESPHTNIFFIVEYSFKIYVLYSPTIHCSWTGEHPASFACLLFLSFPLYPAARQLWPLTYDSFVTLQTHTGHQVSQDIHSTKDVKFLRCFRASPPEFLLSQHVHPLRRHSQGNSASAQTALSVLLTQQAGKTPSSVWSSLPADRG